jgi:hypothetical protein
MVFPLIARIFQNFREQEFATSETLRFLLFARSGLYLALFGLVIWTFIGFFKKKRQVPKLFITVLVLNFLLILGNHLLIAAYATPDSDSYFESLWWTMKTPLISLVWIIYFLKSRRVANTFVN